MASSTPQMERQGQTLSYRSLVTVDHVQQNLAVAYGSVETPAEAGTALTDETKGKVWMDVRFLNATTVDGTPYAAGAFAVTFETKTAVDAIPGYLDTEPHSAVATINEGLWGSVEGIEYQMTVYYRKTVGGVTQTRIVADRFFKVAAPPVGS